VIKDFYDDFAPFYHLIFKDWDESIARQAKTLDQIIRNEWGESHSALVDVSCGIGTQAIGLAQMGYEVDASDLSPEQIRRAKQEAEKRGVHVSFSVADMIQASAHHQKQFDVLISCDNSVPHLLSDSDILAAFKEFHNCLKPGGGCIITIRDYEKESRQGVQFKPYGVRLADGKKYVIFQTWEFNGDIYDLSMYLICESGPQEVEVKVFRSKYYAVSTSKIIELMKNAGFTRVRQIESTYYQPVIIGTKKA